MEKKSAQIPGLDWQYVMDRIKTYGLPSAAIGVGAAGLAHVLALRDRAKKDKDESEGGDTIVIEVPSKKEAVEPNIGVVGAVGNGIGNAYHNLAEWYTNSAGPSLKQYFWDAPLMVGTALGGVSLGYAVVDRILKKQRERQLEDELSSLKRQYSNYLSKDMKTASEDSRLDSFAKALAEAATKIDADSQTKQAAQGLLKIAENSETVGTMLTSLPGVAALLSTILAHNYYYNHLKNVDRAILKDEADKMRLAPKRIQIVSAPQQQVQKPEAKKQQEVPVDELLGKSAGLTSAGALLPITSAANAMAAGNLADAVSTQDGAEEKSNSPEADRERRRKSKIVSEEDLQQIDPNTILLMTDSGPIQIDALDPKALQALEKHKKLILKSFALGMNTK